MFLSSSNVISAHKKMANLMEIKIVAEKSNYHSIYLAELLSQALDNSFCLFRDAIVVNEIIFLIRLSYKDKDKIQLL